MRRLGKILKVILWMVLVLLVLLLAGSFIFREHVTGLIISGFNKQLIKPVQTGSVNFSLLRRFPNASAEIEDLYIFSPVSNDTLLRAERVGLTLNIPSLIRGDVKAGKLVISDGSVHLFKDAAGISNHKFWRETEKSPTKEREAGIVELKNVKLSNVYLSLIDIPASVTVKGVFDELKSRIVVHGDSLSLSIDGTVLLDSVITKTGSFVNNETKLSAVANFSVSDSLIDFNNISALVEGQEVSMSGYIGRHGRGGNLFFQSDEILLSTLFRYLPREITGKPQKYNADGRVGIKMELSVPERGKKGSFSSEIMLSDAVFSLPGTDIRFDRLASPVSIIGNTGNNQDMLRVQAPEVEGRLNGRDFKGSVSIVGKTNPFIDITFMGDIELSEIAGNIKETGIDSLRGEARVSLHVRGHPDLAGKMGIKELFDMNPAVNINLKSISFTHRDLLHPVNGLSGNIMIAENAWFDGITFSYGESHAIINGRFNGLSRLVRDSSFPAVLAGAVWVDRLSTDQLIRPGKEDRKKGEIKSGNPDNISFNLNLQADSLVSGKFGASMFSGNIAYSHNLVNITSFRMNALSGLFEGNAALLRGSGGTYSARGWFDLGNIDISQAFTVFNDFGQKHLLADNINGQLTGSVSISMDADNNFKPDLNTLSVTGNWIIRNGELVHFEPLYKLSGFINLDELRDVSFSELHNDLIIKDQTIIIPTMDITSSAFGLKASGRQHFGGEYDYRLNLSLPELLGNKARENNTGLTEFGFVEDDNLGNTTLFLKLTGEPGDSRISWDMAATGRGIASDIKEEKELLRNILKDEYGWFKRDSASVNKTKETRRFRIEWEEVDSLSRPGAQVGQKRLTLPKIFKKKKK